MEKIQSIAPISLGPQLLVDVGIDDVVHGLLRVLDHLGREIGREQGEAALGVDALTLLVQDLWGWGAGCFEGGCIFFLSFLFRNMHTIKNQIYEWGSLIESVTTALLRTCGEEGFGAKNKKKRNIVLPIKVKQN